MSEEKRKRRQIHNLRRLSVRARVCVCFLRFANEISFAVSYLFRKIAICFCRLACSTVTGVMNLFIVHKKKIKILHFQRNQKKQQKTKKKCT